MIPIEALFFHGEPAIREALALRSEIEAALGTGAETAPLREAMDELWELLGLALPPSASA